jgi:shikimate 5-dehydrogenase
MINKDTLLFGSFSRTAGNMGSMIFNTCFQYHNINAIYKSFSVNNIENAINAAKCLNFSGFAVSMPFKTEIIQYLDFTDEIVKKTNSCNTVINKNNVLYGYNTDYTSVKEYLINVYGNTTINNGHMYILGNGSYSRTVQFCCNELFIKYTIITRDNWDEIKNIKNSIIFNCTPEQCISYDRNSNFFIDCLNTSETGKILAKKQAAIQYKLYLNKEFPFEHVFEL